MKKLKLQITIGYLFSFAVAFAGILFIYRGLCANNAAGQSYSLDEIVLSQVKEGDYVKGNIVSYIGKNVPTVGKERFYGISQGYIVSLATAYEIFTVKTADNKYIRLMVKDNTVIEELNQYDKGNANGKGVYFEGEIIKSPVSINYEWYMDIFQCSSIKEVENLVSPEYVIKPVSFQEKKKSYRKESQYWRLHYFVFS